MWWLFNRCHSCKQNIWRRSPLCESCWEALRQEKPGRLLLGSFWAHYSFLLASNEANSLIYSLKSHAPGIYYQEAANILFLSHILMGLNLRSAIFIPCPSTQKDHAYYLTLALCQLWGGTFVDALTKPQKAKSSWKINDLKQKRLARKERQEIHFDVKDHQLGKNNQQKLVFVDDVITTGATARAAWKALNKPRDFTAVSLAFTPFN